VGISLAYLTHALKEAHPEALVISVDPAMPHREIERPEQYVYQLLQTFGLTANSVVIAGYSGSATVRDDGALSVRSLAFRTDATGVDPACERVLANLARLIGSRVDAVVLDGNHDPEYLRGELEEAARLLRPGGLCVLDDVSEGVWQGIADVFEG